MSIFSALFGEQLPPPPSQHEREDLVAHVEATWVRYVALFQVVRGTRLLIWIVLLVSVAKPLWPAIVKVLIG